MHNLTPTAAEMLRVTRRSRPSGMDRLAAFHARTRRRRVIGVRLSALVAAVVLVASIGMVGVALGMGPRFVGVSPHPFWIVVLLAAGYYGTREALWAAVVASVALLWNHFPGQTAGEGGYAWLLRATREPLLWLVAAIVLGEIRDAFRRRTAALQEALIDASGRADGLNRAVDRLSRQKQHLETRVAEQATTVNAIYSASRAIDRDSVGDVLLGVTELVHAALHPQKFSLFLHQGTRLEAAISDGWAAGDRFARVFDASAPLYRAIVTDRRHLAVVSTLDEPAMAGEGILAGPIIDSDTRHVIGMLKVESMEFLDLHAGSVQTFRLLCSWIGAALTQAQRGQRMPAVSTGSDWGPDVAPPWLHEPMRALMTSVALRTGIEASILQFELTLDRPMRHARALDDVRRLVARTLQAGTLPEQLRCATDAPCGCIVFLPYLSVETAKPFAARLMRRLREALEDEGVHAMVRQRLSPLIDTRRRA